MADIEQRLSRIDLNLLVSLSVLLRERNVSKAAEMLYLSQSAMSRTLQRLRDLFDDPLFHRTSRGITPTARALELELMLPKVLANLSSIIEPPDFHPETAERTFSISMPPIISQLASVPLITYLQQHAPNIAIEEHPLPIVPTKWLEDGTVDFALHIIAPEGGQYAVHSLGEFSPAIYGRIGHPLTLRSHVTLDDCLSFNFVELKVDASVDMHIKHPLNERLFSGDSRKKVIFQSYQLNSLLGVVANTDSLYVGFDALTVASEQRAKLVPIYQFSLPEEQQVALFLISHERVANSPAHQWMEQTIKLILNETVRSPET
ncbi:LysR family transcriptional regulator [Thalassotalea euphylliae]|uniref:LysR family transcriptional regulator n=1 Tax=Thalassotalea euphylliae TaxID=1655234 RepID=UPI003626ADCF